MSDPAQALHQTDPLCPKQHCWLPENERGDQDVNCTQEFVRNGHIYMIHLWCIFP